MEYFLLVLGIVVAATFGFIAYRNWQRVGLLHAIIRWDTFIGVGAGIFVVITSLISILN